MTKILIFIDWYLPGYKAGGPIRSVANFVNSFYSEFDFYIVTRNTDYLENTPYKGVESNKWVKKSEFINVFYCSKDFLNFKNINIIIKSIDFDTLYINGIYSWYFSILPVLLSKKVKNKKLIVAPRGMLSNQAFSSKIFKKKIFISLANILKLYRNIIFQTTSASEKNEIESIIKVKKKVVLISNLPPLVKPIKLSDKVKIKKSLKLISIGRVSKEKNTLFAIKCLSDHKYSGNISFDIYGSIYQKDYWAHCKKIIKTLPNTVKVNYKGEINNSLIISLLNNYHFMFLPSIGENFGHSILESFIAGCPVIISDKTPWQDLESKNVGWDIPLNNKAKYFSTIQYCIDMVQVKYDNMSKTAYNYAEEVSNNTKIKKLSKELFKK